MLHAHCQDKYMYLTSFVHREDLFNIAARWLCGQLHPSDGLRITQILICGGFVVGETLERVAKLLLEMTYNEPIQQKSVYYKGELRDVICRSPNDATPRVKELVHLYKSNPDFYYRETPINGVMCLDKKQRLLGLYRIKRPRRIAEKVNRYIANWIFRMVQDTAREMAQKRAEEMGIPLERLLSSKEEMDREFMAAEEAIAHKFRDGAIQLDRTALTIHDVGGIKIVADPERLARLEHILADHPMISIIDKENHQGDYQAVSLILAVSWDREYVCRRYMDCLGWQKYVRRGIPEAELKKGLEPLLDGAEPTINMELILSTFPDMVESELGNSIHEERIIAQRDNRLYKGYIPMNVELLIEYLFAVGLSPEVHVSRLPVKLWGRYLPETVASNIRHLYGIPEYALYY
ncbi:MAG: hypothetical protein DRH17_00590 [Deltaproteobacteria bacterium]|nr:MAG: hypothetical protein DRH17_00590 [Deltaproteobacteria bacterium]